MHPLVGFAVKALAYVVFVVLLATLTRPVRRRLEARARAWERREIGRLEKAHRESIRNVQTMLAQERAHESFDFGAVRGTPSRSTGGPHVEYRIAHSPEELDRFLKRIEAHTRMRKGTGRDG